MQTAQSKKGSNQSSIWRKCARRWQLFLFMLIPVTYILIFAYYPMFGVQIAFKNFTPSQGIWGSEWVGMANFTRFFSNYMFTRVVSNTIKLSLYSLGVSFPLAILFALIINTIRNQKYKKVVQTITYMPYFISTVVLVALMKQIFNPVIGLYGTISREFFGNNQPAHLLGNPRLFIHFYVWSGVWQSLGWSTIIYIAALSAVSPELHEAAEIDGASRLKRIIHIDFPVILPTASIMLILNAGGLMNVGFEKAYLMQDNTNLKYAEIIATYVYKVGMTAGNSDFSYASAIGLFNSVINCTLLVLVNGLAGRFSAEGSSLW